MVFLRLSTNDCGVLDLKTMEILIIETNLIKDGENIINGVTIDNEDIINIILQSKSGLITILELLLFQKNKNEIVLKKIKEINLKIIGFLKFSLNWVEYVLNMNEEFLLKPNRLYKDATLIYPDLNENTFLKYKYNDDKVIDQIPFSKKKVQKLY